MEQTKEELQKLIEPLDATNTSIHKLLRFALVMIRAGVEDIDGIEELPNTNITQ